MRDFGALLARGIVLFDGGFGSMVAASGVSAPYPEALNHTHPQVVTGVHAAYVAAGAQIIETNSLGCNPTQLARHGSAPDAQILARSAAALARAAAGDEVLVAFSVGTLGDFLRPVGTLSFEEAVSAYSIAMGAAKAAGCDLFIVETMMDMTDMRAALCAGKPLGLPMVASYTFAKGGRTLTGNTPECAAIAAEALGVTALGINCSCGPQDMLAPLSAMRNVTRLPIIVQPNAGLPCTDAHGATHYPVDAEQIVPMMAALLDAGAAGIGGCCGTTPAHIAHMAALCAQYPRPEPCCDGTGYLCSLRTHLPLSDALGDLTHCTLVSPDLGPLYDAEPDTALCIDLTALTPAQIADIVPEAQMACSVPLLFRVHDRAAIVATLRAYTGRTALYAPAEHAEILAYYGAYAL